MRLPDLIGRGMPERIRSVGFAFLGLTAAAGLALVALFAQMGFPLLTPAPLPRSPEPGAVSKAVPLEQGPAVAGLAPAQGAAAVPNAPAGRSGSAAADGGKSDTRVGGSDDLVSAPAPSDAPNPSAPVATSPPPTSPAPAPTAEAPAGTTESTPAAEVPVSTPGSKPGKSTAVDSNPGKPEAKPAATKPSKPEVKPPKPEAAAAPEASYAPAPTPPPAETGKGKGKGEEDEKSK